MSSRQRPSALNFHEQSFDARLLNSGIAARDYGVRVEALVTRDASSIPPPLRDSVER